MKSFLSEVNSVSLKSMEVPWNHYYAIVRRIASFTGMWPYMKPEVKRFAIFLLVISMITVIIPETNYLLMCKDDMQCTVRAITSYAAASITLVKVCTIQLNTHTIKKLTHHLFEDWKQIKTAEEYEIMKSYAETGRQYCLIYCVYSFSAIFAFISMTLIPYSLDILLPLNESRPVLLPYFGNWFVDFREYFFPIYLHSVLTSELIISGLIAHDCFIVTFIEHICSIFSVIGFRFEYLFHECNTEEKVVNDPNDTYCKRIASLVHTHLQALEFAQLLEKTCTMSFFIQIFIVVAALTTTLTQIVNAEINGVLELIKNVLYCVGQLFHLFFLSFEGQKLIDHSLQIREKIYSSLWYNAPTKSKKLLILLIMKSVRPNFLSAGKLYIFSLENFAAILQTSMSYCTILASA